jgi:hypothetical protein
MLEARISRARISTSLDFLLLAQYFQPHYGPGVDSALTEMSTRSLPGVKVRPASKADDLTAIYEPTV